MDDLAVAIANHFGPCRAGSSAVTLHESLEPSNIAEAWCQMNQKKIGELTKQNMLLKQRLAKCVDENNAQNAHDLASLWNTNTAQLNQCIHDSENFADEVNFVNADLNSIRKAMKSAVDNITRVQESSLDLNSAQDWQNLGRSGLLEANSSLQALQLKMKSNKELRNMFSEEINKLEQALALAFKAVDACRLMGLAMQTVSTFIMK